MTAGDNRPALLELDSRQILLVLTLRRLPFFGKAESTGIIIKEGYVSTGTKA